MLRSLTRACLAAGLALAPVTASATPFFNQFFSDAGVALDVNNMEDRAYECTVAWEFRWTEAGQTKTHRFDQKINVPARFSGRVLQVPSRMAAATLSGYRFDVTCN